MLDITSIPVIDNHCHPFLLDQQLTVQQLRRSFTEANDASFVEKHVSNTVYYLWMLRQMASFYSCKPSEEEIVAVRNAMSAEEVIARLAQATNIGTFIFDLGYPPAELCYTAERTAEIAGRSAAKILRMETLMQQLIMEHPDFDEVIERFAEQIRTARDQGYCGLKSIAAYRTGLHIARWSKDEAAASFGEARAEAQSQGRLRIHQKALIDYLLHVAFLIAAEQQLPVQFHTGYGDSDTDMRLGNPLHLRDILEEPAYHDMLVVLLHESYPYSQFGAYLAAIYPQVYFDLSYTIPFIDKLEMLSFTRQALSIAPASKLMYSTDGINYPEMHCIGALRGRSIIGQVLQEMIDADEIDSEQGHHLAELVLRGTATALYRLS